jgi:predicted O-methyltransferase YrrM
MNSVIAIGRARTVLDKVLRRSAFMRAKEQADRIWSSVRPKLTMSGDMAPSNKRTRFARNILAANLPSPTRYLEIGSFEGGSLAFVHALLDGQVQATSIDPFENYGEQPSVDMPSIEQRFIRNMEAIGVDVRVMRGSSVLHLPQLIAANETFDLIYIDGSHHATDVMADAILTWQLLAPGGLMIFDDYHFDLRQNGTAYQPKPAIDAFIGLMRDELDVVDIAAQVFLQRRHG